MSAAPLLSLNAFAISRELLDLVELVQAGADGVVLSIAHADGRWCVQHIDGAHQRLEGRGVTFEEAWSSRGRPAPGDATSTAAELPMTLAPPAGPEASPDAAGALLTVGELTDLPEFLFLVDDELDEGNNVLVSLDHATVAELRQGISTHAARLQRLVDDIDDDRFCLEALRHLLIVRQRQGVADDGPAFDISAVEGS